jgi:hypothetical protein
MPRKSIPNPEEHRFTEEEADKAAKMLENYRKRAEARKEYNRLYQQRAEVKERAAERRAARKAGIVLPRKKVCKTGVLSEEEQELVRTRPYEELPGYLKAYAAIRDVSLRMAEPLDEFEQELIRTTPVEDLPVYLKEYVQRQHNVRVEDYERDMLLNRPYDEWPVYLKEEIQAIVDDQESMAEWREKHPTHIRDFLRIYRATPEGRAAIKKSQEKYFATEKGLATRRKAQREYQRRLRALKQTSQDEN